MSKTQSAMVELGTVAPAFELPDVVTGRAIGRDDVFAGADASAAQSTLQSMQYYAGTQSSGSTALPSNQIITGTDAQMTSNMTSAFTSILQNGVQIALIK